MVEEIDSLMKNRDTPNVSSTWYGGRPVNIVNL